VPDPSTTTLLRACSLQFLFRALAAAEDDEQRAALGEQILQVLADLTGADAAIGFVLIGKDEAALREAAARVGVAATLERVFTEGIVRTTRVFSPCRSTCTARSKACWRSPPAEQQRELLTAGRDTGLGRARRGSAKSSN
jgi:hypothetical protein